MTHGLTWQLLLRADPAHVFDALVETADARHRLATVDHEGRTLTFRGSPGTSAQRTRLCAYVREHQGGALVQFGAVDGLPHRRSSADAAQADEAASIGSLVHEMREHLGQVGTRIVGPMARA